MKALTWQISAGQGLFRVRRCDEVRCQRLEAECGSYQDRDGSGTAVRGPGDDRGDFRRVHDRHGDEIIVQTGIGPSQARPARSGQGRSAGKVVSGSVPQDLGRRDRCRHSRASAVEAGRAARSTSLSCRLPASGEGMAGREDGDLALGEQFLGVEPGQVVERVVKDRDIGTAGPQQPFLFAGATQHHVDVDRSRFGGVGVQQLREQLAGRSGLGRQDDAGVTSDGEGCAAGAMFGSFHSVQRCSSFVQQDRTGLGQGHRAAVTLQQGGTQRRSS